MNAKIKKIRVEALRSGKYKQTDCALYKPREEGYCCLGVLCDVLGEDMHELEEFGMPPEHVCQRADIPFVENADFVSATEIGVKTAKLAEFNDGGKSFKWIASYIERYL